MTDRGNQPTQTLPPLDLVCVVFLKKTITKEVAWSNSTNLAKGWKRFSAHVDPFGVAQTSSRHGDRISRESIALPFSARGPTNCSALGSQSSGIPSRSAIAPMWQTVTER